MSPPAAGRHPGPAGAVLVLRWGAAGDLVQATGALAALRAAWPATGQVLVTHAACAPLGAGFASLDGVEGLAPGETLAQLWRRLAAWRPVAWLDLHGKPRSRLLMLPRRLAHAARLRPRPWRLRLAVRFGGARARPHRPLALGYHEAVERLVGRSLGVEALAWRPPAAARRAARARLDGAGGPGASRRRYVVLAPGAAWASKRWPVGHFRALARAAVAAGLEVWVLGGAADAERGAAIVAGLAGAYALPGLGDWAEAGAVIAGARAVVANDSGAMHLARAQQVPTVAIFGPTDVEQFALAGHQPLSRRLACSPCHFYGQPACPRGHHQCLVGLSVAAVAAALEAAVAGPRPPPARY